ncbi:MAG: hypothetical protein ABSF34_11635, partial [Verrucomicrobiota bacterium]
MEHRLIFQLRFVTKGFPGRSCQKTTTIKVCHTPTPFLIRPESAASQVCQDRFTPIPSARKAIFGFDENTPVLDERDRQYGTLFLDGW